MRDFFSIPFIEKKIMNPLSFLSINSCWQCGMLTLLAGYWVHKPQTMSSFTQSFHIPHKLLFSCLPPRSSAVTNPHLRLYLMSQILCWSGASSVKTLEFRRLEFVLHSVTFEPTSNKEKTRLLQLDFCMWSRKLNIRESRNGCICRACKFNIFRQ